MDPNIAISQLRTEEFTLGQLEIMLSNFALVHRSEAGWELFKTGTPQQIFWCNFIVNTYKNLIFYRGATMLNSYADSPHLISAQTVNASPYFTSVDIKTTTGIQVNLPYMIPLVKVSQLIFNNLNELLKRSKQ